MVFLERRGAHVRRDLPNAGATIAAVAAVALFLLHRRSRYFGNTTPLIVAVILLSLETTGVRAEPWIWALPFVLTFTGGVFADVLEIAAPAGVSRAYGRDSRDAGGL